MSAQVMLGPEIRLRIAIAVVLLAAAAHSLAHYPTTSDDAFISLRYAQNLIDGHGLVWNPGGERVEGFSNPTMVLLSALLLALGVPELWAIKGIGFAAFLASVALLPRLMREIGAAPTAAASGVAAAVLLAAWAPAAMWSMAGLETSLYALLVLAATTQALRESRADRVRWTPWLFLLVAASRPEGLLLGAAAFAAQFVSTPSRRKLVQAWVLGLALPAALLLGARWLYYGSLVPNTYYVKVAAGGGAVQRGFSYLAVFLSSAGGLLCAAAALGLLLGTRSGVRRRWLPLMLAPLAAQIAFVLTAGGTFGAAAEAEIARLKGAPASELRRVAQELGEQFGNDPGLSPPMEWEDVRAMAAQGAVFGGHGASHALLTGCSDAELAAELQTCRRRLTEQLGHEISLFAYPDTRHDARSVSAVRAAGFRHAFIGDGRACTPADDPLRIPRIPVDSRLYAVAGRFSWTLLEAEILGAFDGLRRRFGCAP